MKKSRSIISISLVVIMIFVNGAFSFGQGQIFSDIKGHWAQEYVEDIYGRNITSGYADSTFRPGNNISNLEVAVMVANLLGYDEKVHIHDNLYAKEFSSHEIPLWGQGYLAYLIVKEVVLLDEVKKFSPRAESNLAKRYDVANYIGRALVKYGGQSTRRIYSLPYRDEMLIPQDTKAYVDLLLTLELLNEGSNDRRFLPENNIVRGEVAKLISLAAKILDKYKPEVPVDVIDKKDTNENGVALIKEGILNTLHMGNRIVLTLTHKEEGLLVYDVLDTAVVQVGNKNIRLNQLKLGQEIQIKVVNGLVTEITGVLKTESFNGYFVRSWVAKETVLTVKDEKQETKVFILPSKFKAYLNEEEALLSKFKEGDRVKIFTEDEIITEIHGISKVDHIRGVITDKGPESDPYIEVITVDGEVVIQPIDKDVNLIRDNKLVKYEGIKVSDEVHIQYEYKVPKNIFASTVKRSVEGFIKNIAIGETTHITIETKDNVREEFVLGNNTIFVIGDKAADIYDMQLNYLVQLYIESNEVVRVYSTKQVETHRLVGKVISVDVKNEQLQIQLTIDGEKKTIKLSTSRDSVIIGKLGGRINLAGLKVGDEILAVAQLTKGVYTVERIVILE